MSNLWKPAALAAYCNQGRSGSSLVDSGPNGRTATLQSAGSWSQIAGHKDRWGLGLDGVQYATAPTTLGNFSYSPTLAITAWIAPASYAGNNNICGNRGATGGFLFRLTPTTISFIPFGNASREASLPSGLQPNEWHHVAVRCVASPIEISFFWDGVLRQSYTSGNIGLIPALGTASPMHLWNVDTGTTVITPGAPFSGQGADLCFWNYLANDDIAWLANPANNVVQLPSGQSPHLIAPSLSHGVIG